MSIPLGQSDNDLAIRLAQTEEQVKKLLGVVENLQAELKQQNQKTVENPTTPIDIIGDDLRNILSYNESNLTLGLDPSVNVPIPQVPVEELWPFQVNAEIDWDDLGLLDDLVDFEQEQDNNNKSIINKEVPESTFSNITSDNHKHGRDEPIDAIRGESSREIKAMRHDSLDRIMNYTVQASSVSDKNLIHIDVNVNYDEERKSISDKIFKYMNNGDMNRLAKFVSDYVCDSLTMHYCQIAETIHGKAELMMLFSLLYETYPDGIRKVLNTSIYNKVIVYDFMFTGTSVFDTPLAVSFHQVKEHEHQLKYFENSEEYIAHQNIMRNVAEYNPTHLGDVSSCGTVSEGIASIYHTTITGTTSISSTSDSSTTTSAGVLRASPIHFPGNDSGDVIVLPRSKGRDTLRLATTRAGSFSFGSNRQSQSLPLCTTTTYSPSSTSAITGSASTNNMSSHSGSMSGVGSWFSHLTPTLSNSTTHHHTTRTTTSASSTGSIYQRSRPQSLNSEMMTTALLSKTLEVQRRRMEVTFNDYNRIVQIVITPATK